MRASYLPQPTDSNWVAYVRALLFQSRPYRVRLRSEETRVLYRIFLEDRHRTLTEVAASLGTTWHAVRRTQMQAIEKLEFWRSHEELMQPETLRYLAPFERRLVELRITPRYQPSFSHLASLLGITDREANAIFKKAMIRLRRAVAYEELKKSGMVSMLTPREREIIEDRWLSPEPSMQRQIAEGMGVTRQEVSRLECSAKRKLRAAGCNL